MPALRLPSVGMPLAAAPRLLPLTAVAARQPLRTRASIHLGHTARRCRLAPVSALGEGPSDSDPDANDFLEDDVELSPAIGMDGA